uniref:Uncharacterized protein n=1 Tax=Arundo donax TaxID=35708 RepID=A0A0A9BWF9_ARUDO
MLLGLSLFGVWNIVSCRLP